MRFYQLVLLAIVTAMFSTGCAQKAKILNMADPTSAANSAHSLKELKLTESSWTASQQGAIGATGEKSRVSVNNTPVQTGIAIFTGEHSVRLPISGETNHYDGTTPIENLRLENPAGPPRYFATLNECIEYLENPNKFMKRRGQRPSETTRLFMIESIRAWIGWGNGPLLDYVKLSKALQELVENPEEISIETARYLRALKAANQPIPGLP